MGKGGSSSNQTSHYTSNDNKQFGSVGNDFGKVDFSNLFGGGLTLNYGTQYTSGTTYDQKFGNSTTNNTTNAQSSSQTSKGGDGGGFDLAASVGVGVGGDGSGGSVSQSRQKQEEMTGGGVGGSTLGTGGASAVSGIKGTTIALIGGGVAISAVCAYFLLRK